MHAEGIAVVGEAFRRVAPDSARLDMEVVEVDDDQRAAFARCGPRVSAVVDELEGVVGTDGTVTTGAVRVARDYDDFDEDDREPRRHAASCAISVECPPGLAAEVVSKAIESGVDELEGPQLLLLDSSTAVDQLLQEAIGAARRKAERLAAAAGQSLGHVVAIEERARGADPFEDHSVLRAASGGIDFQPARLTLTATVRVTYALVRGA